MKGDIDFNDNIEIADGATPIFKGTKTDREVTLYNLKVNSYDSNEGGKIELYDVSDNKVFSVNNAGTMEVVGDTTLKKSLSLKSPSDTTIFKVDEESGNTEIHGSLNVKSQSTTLNGDVTLGDSTSDTITSNGDLFAYGTNYFNSETDITGKTNLGNVMLGGDLQMTNRQSIHIVDQNIGAFDIISKRILQIDGITLRSATTNITCRNHGLLDGDFIVIRSIVKGMVELNDREFMIQYIDSNSFQLLEMDGTVVDSSNYTQYENDGGGKITKSLMRLDSMNARTKTTISSDVRVMGDVVLHGAMKMEGTRDELISFSNPRSVTLKKDESQSLQFISSKDIAMPTPGITRSNPALVRTFGEHLYVENNNIIFANVNGMENINGKIFQVHNAQNSSFELRGTGANTAGMGYTTGLDGNGGLIRSFDIRDAETIFSGSGRGCGAYQYKLKIPNAGICTRKVFNTQFPAVFISQRSVCL